MREFTIACFQCWSSILRSWDWALSCSSTRRPYPNSKHTCNSASTTTSSLFSNRYWYLDLPSCFPSSGFTGLSPSTMEWRRSFVLSRQNPLHSWYDCTVFVMKKEGGASRCVCHVAHVCICSKQKGCVTCSGAVAMFWLRLVGKCGSEREKVMDGMSYRRWLRDTLLSSRMKDASSMSRPLGWSVRSNLYTGVEGYGLCHIGTVR